MFITKMIDLEHYSGLKGGRKMDPVFITIHESNSPKSAVDFAADLSDPRFPESCHYCVDEENVVQLLPDNVTGHHAGDGSYGPGNSYSIGIEVCRNESKYPERYEQAKENAAELVAVLMERYSIPLENVVQHNHWDESDCPKRMRKEKKWKAFLKKCLKYENKHSQKNDI